MYPNLTGLAADKDRRSAFATNRGLGPDVFRVLAASTQLDVRLGVAANPAAPPEVLAALIVPVADADWEVLAAVAGNPSTPPEVLGGILNHSVNDTVRVAVAKNPSTPSEHVARLLYDWDEDVRGAAAGRVVDESLAKTTKPLATLRLDRDCPEDFLCAVASSRSCPPELLRLLALRCGTDVGEAVAANPSAGADTLTELSTAADSGTRVAVAGNPSTPLTTVGRLSNDAHETVRRAALSWNGWTPEQLEMLSKRPDDRDIVARHSGASEQILRELAHSDDGWLAQPLATNPATPLDVLDDLAARAVDVLNEDVLDALAHNPAVGPLIGPDDIQVTQPQIMML